MHVANVGVAPDGSIMMSECKFVYNLLLSCTFVVCLGQLWHQVLFEDAIVEIARQRGSTKCLLGLQAQRQCCYIYAVPPQHASQGLATMQEDSYMPICYCNTCMCVLL